MHRSAEIQCPFTLQQGKAMIPLPLWRDSWHKTNDALLFFTWDGTMSRTGFRISSFTIKKYFMDSNSPSGPHVHICRESSMSNRPASYVEGVLENGADPFSSAPHCPLVTSTAPCDPAVLHIWSSPLGCPLVTSTAPRDPAVLHIWSSPLGVGKYVVHVYCPCWVHLWPQVLQPRD